MIRHKVLIGVLAVALTGVGGGIAISNASKVNVSTNLKKTNQNVENYIDRVNNTLNLDKANITNLNRVNIDNKSEINNLQKKIDVLQEENKTLQEKNNSLNGQIKDLLDALSIMKGNLDYKNMNKAKQMGIISTLLHYWGYSQGTSNIISRILFGLSDHWWGALNEEKSIAPKVDKTSQVKQSTQEVEKTSQSKQSTEKVDKVSGVSQSTEKVDKVNQTKNLNVTKEKN